jgi:hypothetical protein
MEDRLSDIEESILHLIALQEPVSEYIKSYFKTDKNDAVIRAALESEILIKSCSFLDEFATFKGLTKDHENILDFRTRIKPVEKQISSWKDLREFRNIVLSHNYSSTSKSKENFFGQGERVYNIPSKPASLKLLAGCIYILTLCVKGSLSEEYNNLLSKRAVLNQPTFNDEKFSMKEADKIFHELNSFALKER